MEYVINVSFNEQNKSYFFKTEDNSIKKDDFVVVETVVGLELGKVVIGPREIETVKTTLNIIPIKRKANDSDLAVYNQNKKDAEGAKNIFKKLVIQEKLDMDLIDAQYTLDKTKILFTYTASDRVDFRNLLKLLAAQLRCRIELKQLNARERAQMVGGIGICGLPLCCTVFFKEFEGVSLNKAKNQMLAINIPKISGQCGKLMCCLKFEDDLYTEAKNEFPAFNTPLKYEGENYTVAGYNIISKIVKIQNEENIQYIPLDEINKILHPQQKQHTNFNKNNHYNDQNKGRFNNKKH